MHEDPLCIWHIGILYTTICLVCRYFCRTLHQPIQVFNKKNESETSCHMDFISYHIFWLWWVISFSWGRGTWWLNLIQTHQKLSDTLFHDQDPLSFPLLVYIIFVSCVVSITEDSFRVVTVMGVLIHKFYCFQNYLQVVKPRVVQTIVSLWLVSSVIPGPLWGPEMITGNYLWSY